MIFIVVVGVVVVVVVVVAGVVVDVAVRGGGGGAVAAAAAAAIVAVAVVVFVFAPDSTCHFMRCQPYSALINRAERETIMNFIQGAMHLPTPHRRGARSCDSGELGSSADLDCALATGSGYIHCKCCIRDAMKQ